MVNSSLDAHADGRSEIGGESEPRGLGDDNIYSAAGQHLHPGERAALPEHVRRQQEKDLTDNKIVLFYLHTSFLQLFKHYVSTHTSLSIGFKLVFIRFFRVLSRDPSRILGIRVVVQTN